MALDAACAAVNRALPDLTENFSDLISPVEAPHPRAGESAMANLYDYACRTGFAHPAETYYRYLGTIGVDLVDWSERDLDVELGLRVFLGSARALAAIIDDQVKHYEHVEREIVGERKLGRMRQRRAGRRAKRQERKSRRPAAVKKYLGNQARNRAEAAKVKKTQKAAPARAPKPRDGHGDVVGRSRAKAPTPAKGKPQGRKS